MNKRIRLGSVSITELSRSPGTVLRRVQQGERLLVRRHKKALATLQPLDGSVLYPLIPNEVALDGSPLGDAMEEADGLTEIERALLTDAVRFHKIHPIWVGYGLGSVREALEDMATRGLVRWSKIGWVLRGRGMMLREVLLARAGLQEEDTWRIDYDDDWGRIGTRQKN